MKFREFLESGRLNEGKVMDKLKKKYNTDSHEEAVIYQELEQHFPKSKLSDIKITKRGSGERSFQVKIDGDVTVMSALPEKVRKFAYQVLNTR